jgi:hypothetical protein
MNHLSQWRVAMSKFDSASRQWFGDCLFIVCGGATAAMLMGLPLGVAKAAGFGGGHAFAMPVHVGGGHAAFMPHPAPVVRAAPQRPVHAKYVPQQRPAQMKVAQEHKAQPHVSKKQPPQSLLARHAATAKAPAATHHEHDLSTRQKLAQMHRTSQKHTVSEPLSHQNSLLHASQQASSSHQRPSATRGTQPLLPGRQHAKSQAIASRDTSYHKSIDWPERLSRYDDWRHSRWARDWWWYHHHFHDYYGYWEHYALWHDGWWWYPGEYDDYVAARRQYAIAVIESQIAYAQEVLDEAVSSGEQAQSKLDGYQARIAAARSAIGDAMAEQSADNKSMHEIEAQMVSEQGPDSELGKAQAKVDEIRLLLDKEAHRVLSLPQHSSQPKAAECAHELAILSPDQKDQLKSDAQFRAAEEELKAAIQEVVRVRRKLFETNKDWVAARDAATQAQHERAQADNELGKYTGPVQLGPKSQLHTAEALASQAREIIAAGRAALRSLGVSVPYAGSSASSS